MRLSVFKQAHLWASIALITAILLVQLPVEWTLAGLVSLVLLLLGVQHPLVALGLMLILAPLRTLIATEASLQLPLDIGQWLFLVLLATWGLNRVLHRQPILAFKWSRLYHPFFVYLLVTSLSMFAAYSIGAWLTEWLKWLIMLILVVLVVSSIKGRDWEWLIFLLVMAGIGNAVIGLYIFFGGSGADHLLITGHYFRAFGTFGQPNPFGGFMGLLIPIAGMASLGYGWRAWLIYRFGVYQENKIFRNTILIAVFYACASGLLLAGLIASWSRGAWIGFIVSAGVMLFALPRKLSQSIALSLIGIAVLAGLWFGGLLPQSIAERISSSTAEYFTINDVRGVDITSDNYAIVERLAHWQAALNMAESAPYLGIGLGNYELAYADFRLLNWKEALGHAHNYYLNILGETGIIGLFTYLAFWSSIVYFTWQIRQAPDALVRAMGIALLGSWSYLAVHSLLDNLYVNNLFLHLGVLFGILALLYHQVSRGCYDASQQDN